MSRQDGPHPNSVRRRIPPQTWALAMGVAKAVNHGHKFKAKSEGGGVCECLEGQDHPVHTTLSTLSARGGAGDSARTTAATCNSCGAPISANARRCVACVRKARSVGNDRVFGRRDGS